jgi:hypothetical protein
MQDCGRGVYTAILLLDICIQDVPKVAVLLLLKIRGDFLEGPGPFLHMFSFAISPLNSQ